MFSQISTISSQIKEITQDVNSRHGQECSLKLKHLCANSEEAKVSKNQGVRACVPRRGTPSHKNQGVRATANVPRSSAQGVTVRQNQGATKVCVKAAESSRTSDFALLVCAETRLFCMRQATQLLSAMQGAELVSRVAAEVWTRSLKTA